jgi:hypothetical protein
VVLCDAPAVVWDVVGVWDALVVGFAAGFAGAECFACPLAGRRNTAPASIVAAARIRNGRIVPVLSHRILLSFYVIA